MKTAEEQISGDSGSINGTRPDPMPWNMRDECEAFPRLDLSSEGLDRECEMARRRVMAHVHDFIHRKTRIVFLDSVVGNTASPLDIVRFYRQTGIMVIPPAPYLG